LFKKHVLEYVRATQIDSIGYREERIGLAIHDTIKKRGSKVWPS